MALRRLHSARNGTIIRKQTSPREVGKWLDKVLNPGYPAEKGEMRRDLLGSCGAGGRCLGRSLKLDASDSVNKGIVSHDQCK